MNTESKTYEAIIVERDGPTFIIRLNRPQRWNAINRQIRLELLDALGSVRDDKTVRAIIIWGGPKVFAAGGDLAEMKDMRPLNVFRPFNSGGDMFGLVAGMLQPVIAAIAGPAFGGGCEIALACDFRIAAENASFGQTEVNVGLIPGAGGTQRLRRLIGETKAKEMIMLGQSIDAAEALRLGLVNKVVGVDQLLEEAKAYARMIAEKPPQAIALAKLMMDKGPDMGLNNALMLESLAFSALFSTDDQKEGANAFLEKRKPNFIGS